MSSLYEFQVLCDTLNMAEIIVGLTYAVGLYAGRWHGVTSV